jgi:hypothetical protein
LKPADKPLKPEKPAKRGRTKQTMPALTAEEYPQYGIGDPDLVTAPEPTTEELEMCETLEDADVDNAESVDADKGAYDKEAVSTVRTEAVKIAKAKFHLELSADEAQTALGLFPKVWFIIFK